jgi:hypothetical protein
LIGAKHLDLEEFTSLEAALSQDSRQEVKTMGDERFISVSIVTV